MVKRRRLPDILGSVANKTESFSDTIYFIVMCIPSLGGFAYYAAGQNYV
jgi:hypothetical protein